MMGWVSPGEKHLFFSPEIGVTGNGEKRATNAYIPWHFLLTAWGILILMFPLKKKKIPHRWVWNMRIINLMKIIPAISFLVRSEKAVEILALPGVWLQLYVQYNCFQITQLITWECNVA